MPDSTLYFSESPPLSARKGRGAVTNLPGRFEVNTHVFFDDGWHQTTAAGSENTEDSADETAPSLHTTVTHETAKSMLTRNSSPDIPFNVSLNPYRGCEHGCIYCFARPTHSYLGLSPGLDFESRIIAKTNAATCLQQELSKKNYRCEPIALGVSTDAYQPVERGLRITRAVLQVLHDARHPVALITKSSLIERDIDLLSNMATQKLCLAMVTLTTLDGDIARTLEPRAAAPTRRLRVIENLARAGIPVGVSIAPVIPFVTEPDLEKVLKAAHDAGAQFANYIVLRLPWEVDPLFLQWLQSHFPDRAERVMNRVRDMRGGKNYDAHFATRMRGEGVWAQLIAQRYAKACARLGFVRRDYAALDCSLFRAPIAETLCQSHSLQGNLF